MKNLCWLRSLRRHAYGLALLMTPPCIAMGASVAIFTPEGKIADIQQVRATFDEAMLPLGSISAPDPFSISCPMRGRAHWIDQKTWVWDMPAAEPEGQKCTFTLRDDLKTLTGNAVTGKRAFAFELPALSYNERIRIAYMQPRQGSTVREDQLFLVTFDRPIQAPRPTLYCIVGDKPRQPAVVNDADQEPIRQRKLGISGQSLAVRCPAPLAESSHLRLILDRGPGRDQNVYDYQVRGPVAADLQCVNFDSKDSCVPSRPFTVSFDSIIPDQFLREIRIRTTPGASTGVLHLDPDNQPYRLGSSSVSFNLKLAPEQHYSIEYPANMLDVDGRAVNKENLPSEIRTSRAPPVVGFEASGIVMLRRSANSSMQLLMDQHPMPAQVADMVVGNDPDPRVADQDILLWLDRYLRTGWQIQNQFFAHPEKFRLSQVRSEHPGSLSLPLREPGLHVFLTAQNAEIGADSTDSLQQQLDRGAVPEMAEAIATSMAVYIKGSAENGAVWVTSLDDAKPIAGASVRVYDRHQMLIWEGDTDANGLAAIPKPMKQESPFTAIARATDRHGRKDISVTESDWDFAMGSNPGYRYFGYRGPMLFANRAIIRADSIMDRTLVKPGEKISMRTVIRSETSTGLAYLEPADRPTTLRIAHQSSSQHWDFPLSWDHAEDALTAFDVPTGAPLGSYTVTLLWGNPDRPESQTDSGSFSVEAYRVPTFSGDLSLGREPVLAGSTPTVALNMHFQDGSPASSLAVKVNATLERYPVGGAAAPGFSEDPFPHAINTGFWPRDGKSVSLSNQQLTLDRNGKASVTLPSLPKLGQDYSIHLEATYLDSSGEVQTISRTVDVRRFPLRLQIAVNGRSNVGSQIEVRVRSLADDGLVRPSEKVSIRAEFSETGSEQSRVPLEVICNTVTDAIGYASCFYTPSRAGEYSFIASGIDEQGHEVASETQRWEYDNADRMKDLFLSADKLQYQPGDIAHIRVTSPFDVSRAWLAVEREGVIKSKIVTLSGPNSEIAVPIDASYGPNVYLSLLAIPPAESLPEGNLPPHATAAMSLGVALSNNNLHVSVAGDHASYSPHQTAQLHIHVTRADGAPATGPLRASLAIVDEALLDLEDNGSWDLLQQMMQQRTNGVATSTPLTRSVTHDSDRRLLQLQDELIQQLKRRQLTGSSMVPAEAAMPAPPAPAAKAAPQMSLDRVTVTGSTLRRADVETPSPVQANTLAEGAAKNRAGDTASKGGTVEMRRLASSLLLWQPDVMLDAKGDATVSVPINDSLSRFRVVAVASADNQQFGSGSTEITVSKDVQIISGLAPLVREGDSLKEIVTLRSRASRALQLDVAAQANGIGRVLAPKHLTLQPGEVRDISFDFTVPKSIKTLQFEISALETGHQDNGDRLAVEQGVLPSVPVEVMASTFEQLKKTLEIPVAAPAGSLPGSSHVEIALQARLAQPMPGVDRWMLNYPYNCIEQRISIALATHDKQRLQSALTDLPKYLDSDGLVNYFPTSQLTRQLGSDVLTAYLLDISKSYGVQLPEASQAQMLSALGRFARGQLQRQSWAPRDDSTARRLAAIAALSLYSKSDAAMVQGIKVDVDDWTTAMLLDWVTALRHTSNLPPQQFSEQKVAQQLHARLTYQGRRAVLSNEKRDFWFWLMQSGDGDMARLVLTMLDQPGWQEEMPRLVQGLLARQTQGSWHTTVANAWGVAAMEQFSAKFESEPVAGVTGVELQSQHASMTLNEAEKLMPAPVQLPLKEKTETLRLSQDGTGAPWATVSVFAAVPLTQARYAGYSIDKSIVPVTQKVKGLVSVGDVYRVKLAIEAQSDSNWVVIRDPVAAGVTILGNGLGRDSAEATRGEQGSGFAWPEYTERDFTMYRSYYRFVPRGKFSTEYTFRVNNPGTFLLPPTRVEAMYAPDVFGELPNAPFKVAP